MSLPHIRCKSVVLPTPPIPIIETLIAPRMVLSISLSNSVKIARFPDQLPLERIVPYFSINFLLIVVIFELMLASSSSKSAQTTIIISSIIV
ncbi:MAG: hypothetical protein ACXACC_05370 [Promethearchaeota archaeon]|jgi:hypothetical protein